MALSGAGGLYASVHHGGKSPTAAHDAGLRIVAHVTSADTAYAVSKIGMDVLAHVPFKLLSHAQVEAFAAAQNVRDLHMHGVTLLAGTDAPNPGVVPGARSHRELQHLVKAGMTPADALGAATSQTAAVFELPDRGEVRAGLRADLLLVDGKPDQNIDGIQQIVGVWQRGIPVRLGSYSDSQHETRSLDALQAQVNTVMTAMRDLLPPGVTIPDRTGGDPH